MGLRQTFGTDKELESKGVAISPDPDTKITILRAGSSNAKYGTAFKRHAEPFMRAIENGTLSPEVDNEIMAKVYAEGVIRDWETRVDGKWKRGIEGNDPSKLDAYNFDNVVNVLLELPDLFEFIKTKATRIATFQSPDPESVKADAKN